MIGRQQVKQLVAKRGPRLDRIGRGCPVDERIQPGRLLTVGPVDDVFPVFSDRAKQWINRLLARRSIGQGEDVPSSRTAEWFPFYHGPAAHTTSCRMVIA
jgi:hypothetical protein